MKYNGSFVIALFTIGIILLFYPYNNCLANNDRTSNADTSVLNNDFIKGELIIKFKQEAGKISPKLTAGIASVGISSVDAIFNRAGATQIKKVFKNKQPPVNKTLPDLSRIFYLKIPLNADVQSIARELSQNPNIEYAEPRYIYKMYDVPDDPLYSDQWYLPKINASDAWDISQGDADVVIGIIDTGVDWTHPDLAENMWTNAGETGLDAQGNNKRTNGIDDDNNGYIDDWNGWDFCGDDGYTPDNDPMDTHGHGTHCSGMASAVTNNEIGVAGLGRNCRIMPIRVIYYTTLLYGPEGIVYAANNGCDIVNLSWGGDPPSSFLNDAIQYAHQSGTFVIAAAGNDDTSEKKYPASYANVLSVAATDENDTKADFSSYGSSIDVSAPGNHMLSAMLDDSYAYMSGTSMAAPLVAGLAGLIKSQNPNWTNVQIANQILMSADNIDELNPQFIGMLGSGRINALNALTYEATPIITYQDFTIDDNNGNQNGVPDPGESVNMAVSLKNTWGNAKNVSVTLSTTDYAITITNNISNYGNINGGTVVNNSLLPFSFTIDEISTLHKVYFYLNITADGGYNTLDTFLVIIGKPNVLLVDDDCDGNNVEEYYTKTLDSLGIAYDYWQHSSKGSPSVNILAGYSVIIWFTEASFPSLSIDDIDNLTSYLNNGGNLFLTGQDIGWDFNDPEGYNYGNPFYADYLHADYVSNISYNLHVVGEVNNPISNDLSYFISGGDGANNQFSPDIIEPKPEANTVFSYSNFQGAGVTYSGIYKVVYFGFGFEGIDNYAMRNTVLNNIIDWFSGLLINHNPLPDTENTSNPYPVHAKVISPTTSTSVYLYWNTENNQAFSQVQMEYIGDNEYVANIPAQQTNTRVNYYIYAVDDNQFSKTAPHNAPKNKYTYYVGTDNIPPTIIHQPLDNTINEVGPYTVLAQINDNVGISNNTVYLHFNKSGGVENSILMQPSNLLNQYTGNIPGLVPVGDVIDYYITASDNSYMQNSSRLPETGYFSFTIVNNLIIDDFESGSDKWNLGYGWGITKISSPSGNYSITDSPYGYYDNNMYNSLTLLKGLGLSTYKTATLGFFTRHSFASSDMGVVEISIDSMNTWSSIKNIAGLQYSWKEDSITLDNYCGNGDVFLRFSLVSDDVITANGWLLDDIWIAVDSSTLGINQNVLQKQHLLSQNFPNPFSLKTTIKFYVEGSDKRTFISICDFNGKKIKTLVDMNLETGFHQEVWDGTDDFGNQLSNGIYFYRMVQGDKYSVFKKMIKMK